MPGSNETLQPGRLAGQANPCCREGREGSVRHGGNPTPKALRPDRREKPLARWGATVPQTDTGGQVEETQVDERTSVKELGKLAP